MLGRNVSLPRLFSRLLVSPGQIQITVMIFLIGCLVHSEILVKTSVEESNELRIESDLRRIPSLGGWMPPTQPYFLSGRLPMFLLQE
ncbi:hypothetical protein GOBAR_DD29102 [Gossypium barbadense]|nr:hypothetical protein GOBAR_DD29102 [Gossypium barbadense]